MASFRKKGVNCLRVSRWPLPDSFYSLADSYGLYICDRANIDTASAASRCRRRVRRPTTRCGRPR
ncbi:MAG: glycoside hydrolase family 2 TIM barrel-domain containing protein [Alistipes onderdonkii]